MTSFPCFRYTRFALFLFAVASALPGVLTAASTLVLNPTSLTFPAQNLNTSSVAQSFTITNSGSQPVTISSVTTSGDFAISADSCPSSLAAGTDCLVSVTFKPTAAGSRTSSVVVTDNATGSPQSVTLSGTGRQPITTITLNPTSLTFLAQDLNTTSTAQSFTIQNSGNQPVTIGSITTSGSFAISANTCTASLAVGMDCGVSVTFTPTASGSQTSSVVITDNATGSPQSIALSGSGRQLITLYPTSLTFPIQNLNTTSAAKSFTITNTSGQAVTISSITTSGDFAISANNCPASLAVNVSCKVSITFKPTATGKRTSTVVIADNVSGSPQSVALSGTGEKPSTITLSPTSLAFAAQTLNTTSSAQSFTITNSGSQAVTISSITTSGVFAISANTCPASLPASANCKVSVTFTPTATGTSSSSVVITDSVAGSPQSVALSGTGQQPPTTTITESPTSLTFAAQNLNTVSGAQNFTIANSGTQAVTISSIVTSGDFAIGANTCPPTLAAGTDCGVSITFKPTATGSRTSTVVITDNATGSPQSVALSGTGRQPTMTITVNPTSLTYPAQIVNTTSAAQSITIKNSGNQPVTISSITTSGSFAISANACPASLAAGTDCGVSVTFTPTASGSQTSSIVITDSATGSPQSVALSGTGQGGSAPPTITSFAPHSGTIGTMLTIKGSNFGSVPQVSMPNVNGGSVALVLQSRGAGSLGLSIPPGAVTGPITVANSAGRATTASPFTVTAPNTFNVSASPASATLIQGQSVSYTVQLTTSNGFNQLARLAVSGLPKGITAAFKPSSISVGQSSILTLTASAAQPVATTNISISASATVGEFVEDQSAQAGLSVVAPTTTLLGRTVVSDALETPIAGVTVTTLGADGSGNTTGCTGFTTVSDAAGNFALTNLPLGCTGPQVIGFDGSKATAPPGKYDGVHLAFTLTSGKVTPSPVLVHLPRVDNAEVFNVQQNWSTDQTYFSSSIPGVSITVYAGTTLTLPDGTQPNPFPMSVVPVLPDRLPDQKPQVPTMVGVLYLSFQPTGTHASQPVAVTYPNTLNTAPGTNMALMVLDAAHGGFQPVGTGTVSANGAVIVPDPDPAHPGHRYGITNFDW